jgi:fructokinase
MLFASIGEALIDFTPLAGLGEAPAFCMHAGGSPYNVAVGLARCRAQVEYIGKVSRDFFGRFLVTRLAREGVGTRFVTRDAAPTTLAFVALEGGVPTFSFYGSGAADTLLRPEDVAHVAELVDVLHFGSNGLTTNPAAETILSLAHDARGRRFLSFDPNVRPGLADDGTAYRRRLDRGFRVADLVKLSRADLEWLMPGRAMEDAAAALRGFGAALVVVTLGAAGCYGRWAAGEVRVPALPVDVVDTVGAGDAFASGLLCALGELGLASRPRLERAGADEVGRALRFAVAAAGLTCARAGADPPRRDDIERYVRLT